MAGDDEEKEMRWLPGNTKGSPAPEGRYGHSFTRVGGKFYVFGGIAKSKGTAAPSPNNEFHMLVVKGDKTTWSVPSVSGNPPPPRWHHTATAVGDNKLFVFGGNLSNSARLNDLWLYDTAANEWKEFGGSKGRRGVESKTEEEVKYDSNSSVPTNTAPNAPTPRSAHSACSIDNVLYIFGGYGGSGYQRADFNDLYSLATDSMTWTHITEVTGEPPAARSGHCAVPVQKQMCVYGGWSRSTRFSDLHMFNIETATWTTVEHAAFNPPRWQHACVAVAAVPSWQVFLFGGCRGEDDAPRSQGSFSNDFAVLDTGRLRWSEVETLDLPARRAESSMEYDPASKRLILYGGWANTWLNDVYLLNIGSIVGPPYAVTGIEPKIGPVTGGTMLKVIGLGFDVTLECTVRFITGKKFVEAPGRVVSATEVQCTTPTFDNLGPGMMQVRLVFRGGRPTITYEEFMTFAVTDSRRCLAYGPGILNGSVCAAPNTFIIQARNSNNEDSKQGGDKFDVKIVNNDSKEEVPFTITDAGAGQYPVVFTAPAAGKYTIKVQFAGTHGGFAGPIRGSPFTVEYVKGDKALNKMDSPLVLDDLKNVVKNLTAFSRRTLDGLTAEVPEHELSALLAVKTHLHNVDEQGAEQVHLIDRARSTLRAVTDLGNKSLTKDIERSSKALEAAATTWDDCVKQAPATRVGITPLVRHHATDTKRRIQDYETSVEQFCKNQQRHSFWQYDSGPEVAARSMEDCKQEIVGARKEFKDMAHLAAMFDFATMMSSSERMLSELDESLVAAGELWSIAVETQRALAASNKVLWKQVNAESMEDQGKKLQKKLKTCNNKAVRASNLYKGLDRVIKDYLLSCPLIGALSHQAMRPRHWAKIMEACHKEFTPPHENPDMLVEEILALELHKFNADVEEITDQALKEEKMEMSLAKLQETWSVIEFLMDPYTEGSDVMLLKIKDDDFDQLEADQLIVQGMMASRFLATFETEVTGWQKALAMVAETMQMLSEVQRTWSYLEPLFIKSEEVRRELPTDAERFAGIHVRVQALLREASATKIIKTACNKPGLYEELDDIGTLLEQCKKSLAEFLDSKRRQFPRFYFVSEADLLDILSNGGTPTRIIQHINKVFLSTNTLILDESVPGERPSAVRFTSSVGVEDIPFNPVPKLEGKVEIYLQTVLDAQIQTLIKTLGICLKRYPTQDRISWLMTRSATEPTKPADPAQIVLLTAGSRYVQEVNQAFARLADDPDAMKAQFDLIVMQLNDLIRLTQTDLSKADRQRVMCMITLDAHSRDIVDKLIREHVVDVRAFQWQSQLKQVYEDGRALLRIADACFDYGYEYLGNGGRLVITPLTDRIYVTATQALNLKMGCAPAGPAGTGKTETTKDLASAIGKCCYVFNCSPEMDYRSMGNIFKGLAASGSWGCFDEFNRLVPEVLSVCSVQFKAVCDGIRGQRKTVVVEGDEVALDPTCGAFITMNPGYLGRSELPEGLKALFRPMTVMVPDLVLICENMMMAEGFVEAKVLASKFYGLYSLLRELLSKQLHYDWGLRAVKSVLVVAGSFKRAEPNLPEQDLLMRALRDFNTPKIVQEDEVVFFGLLGDLFPGINPPRKIDLALEDAVRQATVARKLHPDETFLLKTVQLEELLEIRHCVFVMGPPGAGKSNCWKVLADARAMLGKDRKTKYVDLNPKSVSPQELYGYITLATRDWKDGLLSKIMRDLGKEPNTNPKWIILDGDLDANWIESMNSVMDDNKMLTLASNERIPLKPHMRMVFEIRDLKYASPATVSRAGILFISAATGFQWRALIQSWLKRIADFPVEAPAAVVEVLSKCFEKYVAPSLYFLKKETKPLVELEDTALVAALLAMLDQTLTAEVVKAAAADAKECARIVETWFVFCAIWAFGSPLSTRDGEDYRKKFSDYWRGEFKSVKIPARETLYDYWLNPEGLVFDGWKNSPQFAEIEYDSRTPMSSVTVPTPETASVMYWMSLLVNDSRPVMLAGYAGCGKTQLVLGLLGSLDPEVRLSTIINFNFYTNSNSLQVTLEAPLEKKTGTNWGPPGKAKMVFFLDDLNLPEVDPYNTQSGIALLRQHIDWGHWYDRTKLVARNVMSCQYLAALNPTAGSFVINPRLQRHFVTFAIGFPGPTSLHTIYNTFLGGHLKHFNEEIFQLTGNLVNAALGLHALVASTFRKSAVNFHYEFNIRHLSNVFQGLLVAKPDQFQEASKMVMLWLHESERVYGDRLVSLDDLNKYKNLAVTQAKKRFPMYNMANFYAAENADPLVFCHFSESLADRVYNRVTSMERLNQILVAALDEYNEIYTTMDLVLFEDAMRHVCRIARIILNPGGHALLVGVGGSGKQSLSRLSSHICGYGVSQIVISGTYGIGDLKEDLKGMYAKAGLKEEGTTFLFTDSQITNERFLVYINDLLASGNIPDLYADDEVDEIVNTLTPRVKEAGIVPEKKACWKFFLDEVRKNLHVILCFSPVGDDFRARATKFPALVNSTVIDWFQPWPREALSSVARKALSKIELSSDAVRDAIERFMPFSFEAVNKHARNYYRTNRRYVYTTPKSYLELLKLYDLLLARKRGESAAAIDRLANGLQKLRDTAEAVVEIEASLKIKLSEAEEKMKTSEGIAVKVAANKEVVEEETRKAEIEERDVSQLASEVMALQRSAAEDLAKAEPAVEAAMAALDTLNKKDLGECKTMSTPPKGVDDVFGAVVSLLAGVEGNPISANIISDKKGKVLPKNKDWTASKKALLGNVNELLVVLKEFKAAVDSNQVPVLNWGEQGVRPYLSLEWFTPDAIKGKNAAAAGLCSWVVNIVMYRDIVITVEPKRQALREADVRLQEANSRLEVVRAKVADLTATLKTLTDQLAAANAEKDAAIAEVESGQSRLDLANRLTSALADENVRWAEGIEKLTQERELLVGDVLLASAFISYIGPFTKQYRDEMITKQWVPFLQKAVGGGPIPMSESCNPLAILTNDAQVAQWNADGLPDDRVSVENGAIVESTARWPLMIDPQLQGIKWVLEKERANNLVVLRLSTKNMLNKLERAIDSGLPVLLENLGEKIDAVLNPVISRSTMRKGHKQYLKLGDKEVEYHPKFRLYMHTKLSNPHYPPEIQAEAALINFTVTEAGLEDQLLSLVVGKERADLAAIKSDLVVQQNQFKIKIKKLEDDILQRLATAEGDITQDVALITGLEDTKRIATDIAEKQLVARNTEAAINIISEKYRPVATRGALLFFLMNELFRVHTYYVYSLGAFVTVFLRAIDMVSGENDPNYHPPDDLAEEGEAAEGAEGGEAAAAAAPAAEEAKPDPTQAVKEGLNDAQLAERCKLLMDSITTVSFNYLRRGVFEVDKLTIAVQLCLRIMVRAKLLDADAVTLFMVGGNAMEPGAMGPLSDWLPESIWPKVKALEAVKPALAKLGDDMQSNSMAWQKWFDSEKPEQLPCPGTYANAEPLHKLLILRAMRPDRLRGALTTFVADNLGEEFVSQQAFDMAATYAETSPSVPVFFVLFPGVDPTTWVEALGKKLGFTSDNGKFRNISMGQGQEKPAEDAVTRFAQEGGWIMLQNLHLMQTWVPVLERQLEVVSATAHADFRCFISAEPPPISYMKNMPESLMQSCVKVANEAPSDLKSNLRRGWANFTADWVNGSSKKEAFKACLLTMCFYHAIVQGRRRFGQQGWSKRYSFNQGDLLVCSNILMDYLANNAEVPWDDLRYIFGEIMYGGHITDAWDRRTNNTYLKELLNPSVLVGGELCVGFKVPDCAALDYSGIANYIETAFPRESPPMFGLHANAEIGFLTSSADNLLSTIVILEGGGGAGSASGDSVVRGVLNDLLERLPENFVLLDIRTKAEPLLKLETAPFVLVAMQECGRMNVLLDTLRDSLIELRKGLDGQLNMSDAMEDLSQALSIGQVPGRNPFHKTSWEKVAWWSRKSLQPWFQDLLRRVEQLERWSSELVLPVCMWLPGLFNPMAFLTAIMQITARKEGQPLDKMVLETHVTTMMKSEQATAYPQSGAFCHGIFIEGARWPGLDEASDSVYDVKGVKCYGYCTDGRLKELLPLLPVVYVRAVVVEKTWEPTEVGYMRHNPNVFDCPVYFTTMRGPTYIFLATLATRERNAKWVLAGVALILQED